MQSVVSDDLGERQKQRRDDALRPARQFVAATVNKVFDAYKRDDDRTAAEACVHLFDGFTGSAADITERSEAITARLFRMSVPCEIARAIVMMAVTMLDLGDEDEQDDQLRPGMVLVA